MNMELNLISDLCPANLNILTLSLQLRHLKKSVQGKLPGGDSVPTLCVPLQSFRFHSSAYSRILSRLELQCSFLHLLPPFPSSEALACILYEVSFALSVLLGEKKGIITLSFEFLDIFLWSFLSTLLLVDTSSVVLVERIVCRLFRIYFFP